MVQGAAERLEKLEKLKSEAPKSVSHGQDERGPGGSPKRSQSPKKQILSEILKTSVLSESQITRFHRVTEWDTTRGWGIGDAIPQRLRNPSVRRGLAASQSKCQIKSMSNVQIVFESFVIIYNERIEQKLHIWHLLIYLAMLTGHVDYLQLSL